MSHDEPASAVQTLDQLADRCARDLLTVGAAEYDLPEEFRLEAEFAGEPTHLYPRLFSGGAITYGRVTRLRAGPRAQVFNMVVLPVLGTTLPIVALEVLVFGRGVHLFVLDLFDTGKTHPVVAEALEQTRSELATEFLLAELPDWGRDVFSPQAIMLRGKDQPVPLARVALALDRVWTAWATLATNPTIGLAENAREERMTARDRFIKVQGTNEPARPFFERMAGSDWTSRFTHEFLYPRWLLGAENPPPWPMKNAASVRT